MAHEGYYSDSSNLNNINDALNQSELYKDQAEAAALSADDSEAAALSYKNSAATSATNASTSASNAAGSATSASSSAANASLSANNAANSESNASGSASAAAASAASITKQTSITDTTPTALLINGAWGLGHTGGAPATNLDSPSADRTGFYVVNGSQTNFTWPTGLTGQAGLLTNMVRTTSGTLGQVVQKFYTISSIDAREFVRSSGSSTFSPWKEITSIQRDYNGTGVSFNTNTTLTSSQIGIWVITSTTGLTLTLPAVDDVAVGKTIVVINNSLGALAVAATTGNVNGSSTFNQKAKEIIEFTNNGLAGGGWYITSRSTMLPAIADDSGWITPTLINSWTHLTQTFQYRRIGNKVYFRGAAQNTTFANNGTTLFTLPAGYRPQSQINTVNTGASLLIGFSTLSITTAGVVTARDSSTASGTVAVSGMNTEFFIDN